MVVVRSLLRDTSVMDGCSKNAEYIHLIHNSQNMDVSKNSGTPKWMVKIMENPIKMDDLGGNFSPYFWFNTHIQ